MNPLQLARLVARTGPYLRKLIPLLGQLRTAAFPVLAAIFALTVDYINGTAIVSSSFLVAGAGKLIFDRSTGVVATRQSLPPVPTTVDERLVAFAQGLAKAVRESDRKANAERSRLGRAKAASPIPPVNLGFAGPVEVPTSLGDPGELDPISD